MHESQLGRVYPCVKRVVFGLVALAAPTFAGDLDDVAAGIEFHYNRLAGMRLDFEQEISYAGRRKTLERGTLALLRPGRMRWDYSKPPGKLLVSDGDWLRMYNPYANQVQTVRIEESEDLRAPLSFLLGRLRLKRQFRDLRLEAIDGESALVGRGRTGAEAYDRVEFYFDPEAYRLNKLRVFGRDGAITEFRFSNEELNPPLRPEQFEFHAPAGAEILPEIDLEESR